MPAVRAPRKQGGHRGGLAGRLGGVVVLIVGFSLLTSGDARAQESASYRLVEHAFNGGGHPEAGTTINSASYRMTMDTIGEGVVGPGLRSGSYRSDGGFVSGYRPAGPVVGLGFVDGVTLVWDPERSAGVYNLYRDWLGALSGLGYGDCEQQDLTDETAIDSDTPSPAGRGYFYLVTAENRLSEEGTKGRDSSDDERPNTNPCP